MGAPRPVETADEGQDRSLVRVLESWTRGRVPDGLYDAVLFESARASDQPAIQAAALGYSAGNDLAEIRYRSAREKLDTALTITDRCSVAASPELGWFVLNVGRCVSRAQMSHPGV